ncbi:MAG TPA: CopD family protein [Jatrophihabitans sp.]|nr:CopD family protein [Jatrophihabitans sp.]
MASLPARGACAAAAGLAFLAAAVWPIAGAAAHAVFVAASPAPGAALRMPPRAVRIDFSEPLDAALSGIALYTSADRPVRTAAARVAPRDPRSLTVPLPRLRPDRYTVVWHSVSAIDGHTRRGSYAFTVDRPDGSLPHVSLAAAGPRGPPEVPSAGQAAALWCGLAGLFALVGAVLVSLLCGGPGPTAIRGLRGQLRRQLSRLTLAGAVLVAAGAAGEVISDWAPTGWGASALASLLSSSAGRWHIVRVAAVAVVVLVRPAARRAAPRAASLAGALGAGVAAFSFAATAHGAASALPGLGLGTEFVHVLASSVWLGGAIALAVAWAVLRDADPVGYRALLRRYSIVAGVAVPLVLATGLGNALLDLGSPGDLLGSAYGVSLLVKLVAVAVLLGIAALNAVVLRPADEAGHPRGRRLRYTLALEAALGIAILVPTALLGVLAPARPMDEARAVAQQIRAEPNPAVAFAGTVRLDGRDVDVSLTPGAVGVNAVRVEVAGTYHAAELRLSLTGPGEPVGSTLARTGRDHDPGTHTVYAGALRLSRPGTWRAVLRGTGPGPGASLVVPVSPAVRGFATAGGAADVGPWIALLALAGGAGALGALARAPAPRRGKAAALVAGGVGVTVALAWAGNLTFGPGGAAAPAASWGAVRTVRPVQLPDAKLWQVPTPGAGVMTPAVAPDGSVWVAEMNAGKLARLDPHGNVIQEFRFPGRDRESMGTAVDAAGRVWIAQEHAMALAMFDPAAGRYREFAIPGSVSAPVGVATGPHGDIWFTEMSGNRIGRFDPRTLRFRTYPVPTADSAPYWLAAAPDGSVWFTEFGAGRVGVLDPRSGRIREYAVPGRHPNAAGIAVDPDGTVWFTTLQGELVGLTPTTGRLRRMPLPAPGDYGVAVAPDHTVWVGCQGGRALYAVAPSSGAVHAVRFPAGSAPWWPVVDPRGRVWVALSGTRSNGLALVHRPS